MSLSLIAGFAAVALASLIAYCLLPKQGEMSKSRRCSVVACLIASVLATGVGHWAQHLEQEAEKASLRAHFNGQLAMEHQETRASAENSIRTLVVEHEREREEWIESMERERRQEAIDQAQEVAVAQRSIGEAVRGVGRQLIAMQGASPMEVGPVDSVSLEGRLAKYRSVLPEYYVDRAEKVLRLVVAFNENLEIIKANSQEKQLAYSFQASFSPSMVAGTRRPDQWLLEAAESKARAAYAGIISLIPVFP